MSTTEVIFHSTLFYSPQWCSHMAAVSVLVPPITQSHAARDRLPWYGQYDNDNEEKFINLNAELIQFEVVDCAEFSYGSHTTKRHSHKYIFIDVIIPYMYYILMAVAVCECECVCTSSMGITCAMRIHTHCFCRIEKTIGKCMQNKWNHLMSLPLLSFRLRTPQGKISWPCFKNARWMFWKWFQFAYSHSITLTERMCGLLGRRMGLCAREHMRSSLSLLYIL